ncbi:Pycsar system effector family protein [Streptomyces sp. NPDC005953]|uniref:Pycsar system effector family protein n=1 Tax=Streptomyces sp. NPDC005953 TaxID=3156719 RepID=UPI0034046459
MSTLEAGLTAAHAEVKAEIARTDTKTSLLLAFIGAVLAGVWTAAKDVPLPVAASVAGGLGVLLLVAAAGLLLRAVRPRISGAPVAGFPLWATLTADEIRARLAHDERGQDIVNLSRIAIAKYRTLRRAVDLVCAGGMLLITAAAFTIGGAA